MNARYDMHNKVVLQLLNHTLLNMLRNSVFLFLFCQGLMRVNLVKRDNSYISKFLWLFLIIFSSFSLKMMNFSHNFFFIMTGNHHFKKWWISVAPLTDKYTNICRKKMNKTKNNKRKRKNKEEKRNLISVIVQVNLYLCLIVQVSTGKPLPVFPFQNPLIPNY